MLAVPKSPMKDVIQATAAVSSDKIKDYLRNNWLLLHQYQLRSMYYRHAWTILLQVKPTNANEAGHSKLKKNTAGAVKIK